MSKGWPLLRKWNFLDPPVWACTPFQSELFAKHRLIALQEAPWRKEPSFLRLWTRMLSTRETQRNQVSQTRNRKGLYTTPLPAVPCSQASIRPSMFQLQQTLPSAVWFLAKFVITSGDCFSVLPCTNYRLLVAYCISHSLLLLLPCTAQPPKAPLPELNLAAPRQESPPPWCGLCLLKGRQHNCEQKYKTNKCCLLQKCQATFNESPFTVTKRAVSLLKHIPDHGWYLPKGSIGGRTPDMHKLRTTYSNRHQTQKSATSEPADPSIYAEQLTSNSKVWHFFRHLTPF